MKWLKEPQAQSEELALVPAPPLTDPPALDNHQLRQGLISSSVKQG